MKINKAVLIMIALIMIPMVSAFEFDNSLTDYDEETKTITYENCFGLCDEIASVTLNTEIHKLVTPTSTHFAEFTINSKVLYDEGWYDNIKLYTKSNPYTEKLGDEIKSPKIIFKYYDTDYVWYENVSLWDCEDKVNKVKCVDDSKLVEHIGDWVEFNPNEKILTKDEILKIRLYYPDAVGGQTYEWIPQFFNTREVTEWADFTAYTLFESQTKYTQQELIGYRHGEVFDSAFMCQNFTIGANGTNSAFTLRGVSVKLAGDASKTNTLYTYIVNSTGTGLPCIQDSRPTVALTCAGGVIARNIATTIPASATVVITNITLNSTGGGIAPILNASEMYWLCFNTTEAETDQPSLGTVTTNEYSGGERWMYDAYDSGAWRNRSTAYNYVGDMWFKIWGETFDASPIVTLNSPANNSAFLITNVSFNCSATDDIGLSNLSLFLNGLYNQSVSNTSASQTSLKLNTTISNMAEGTWLWTCLANDTSSQTHRAGNYTFTIDTTPLINYTIPTPSNNTYQTSLTLNVSLTETYFKNLTYYIFNSSQDLYEKRVHTNATRHTIFTLPDADYFYNITVWTTTDKKNSTKTRNVTIDTTYPSISIIQPSGTIDVWDNDTSFNYTRTDGGSGIDTCIYSLDNFTTNITLANCINLTINITAGNQTVYLWANDTLNNHISTSSNYYGFPKFDICNATLNIDFVNFTFKDEGTNNNINATIDSLDWDYWFDNQLINSSFTYSASKENYSFAFCTNTSDYSNLTIDGSLTYSNTSYPIRNYVINHRVFDTVVDNIILYLLNSVDGIYVTYQVITQAGQPITDVNAYCNRTVGGSPVTVGSGTTGGDGGVTFWLNPDYSHTCVFSKTGYDTETITHTPTQSTYTVTMGGDLVQNATDTSRGITYKIEPSTYNLENKTEYTFNFTITTTYWDLDEFGFILKNGSGNEIGRNSSVVATGGSVKYTMNTINNSSIIMYYYYDITGNLTNGTRLWSVWDNYGDDWSIKKFVTHLKTYTSAGMFGLDDFGLTLIIFVLIFIAVGIISYYSGVYSPSSIVIMATALVLLFDFGLGLIPPNPRGVSHLYSVFMVIISTLLLIWEFRQ